MTPPPTPETLAQFKQIVGPKGFIDSDAEKHPYLIEWRGLWEGSTPLVLRPANTSEVSAIMKLAHATQTAIVPQSGNTALVGGQIPNGGEVLLSLDRMTRIIDVDATDFTITVEAGVTLKAVQEAAAEAERLFPLSLASEGSCRMGGVLSTNAGGVNVLAYGNARDLCLGLEVVLADGRVLNLLKHLRKDNTGYDLKHIFIGAEGTLGIITAASLKLYPKPMHYETALVSVPDVESALALLARAKQKSGNKVVAFELLPELGVQFTVQHMATRRAIETVSPWYVLFELADAAPGVAESILEEALENGHVTDGTLAQSDNQRLELWALRENMSEAQKFEGGSIKHDVSVPVSALPRFIAEASEAVEQFQPGVRICCFGHMGDGNMHFNVSQPLGMDKQAYLARWHDMNEIVHRIVADMQGSISAEHGIGILKREDMRWFKPAVALDVMRAMKQALDPQNILNPGRIIPEK